MIAALNRSSLKIVRALRGECFWFLSYEVFAAERQGSAAAGSGSDAGADAGGSWLQPHVRRRLGPWHMECIKFAPGFSSPSRPAHAYRNTSSARERNNGESVRPSASAVLRLTAQVELVRTPPRAGQRAWCLSESCPQDGGALAQVHRHMPHSPAGSPPPYSAARLDMVGSRCRSANAISRCRYSAKRGGSGVRGVGPALDHGGKGGLEGLGPPCLDALELYAERLGFPLHVVRDLLANRMAGSTRTATWEAWARLL